MNFSLKIHFMHRDVCSEMTIIEGKELSHDLVGQSFSLLSLALFRAAQIYLSLQFAVLPWQAEQVSMTSTAL